MPPDLQVMFRTKGSGSHQWLFGAYPSVDLSLPHQKSMRFQTCRGFTPLSLDTLAPVSLKTLVFFFKTPGNVCKCESEGGPGSFGEMYKGIWHNEPLCTIQWFAWCTVQETMFKAADCLCRFFWLVFCDQPLKGRRWIWSSGTTWC